MAYTKNLTCMSCKTVNKIPEDKLGAGPKCGSCGKPLAAGQVHDTDLATVIKCTTNDELPVVVDMWAPWCGPCRTMAPEFDKAAKDLKTVARFAKINTDKHQNASQRYNIRGIPALLLFKNGKEIARHAGVMRANELVKWVKTRSM